MLLVSCGGERPIEFYRASPYPLPCYPAARAGERVHLELPIACTICEAFQGVARPMNSDQLDGLRQVPPKTEIMIGSFNMDEADKHLRSLATGLSAHE